MNISDLNLNRNLQKNTVQSDSTKGAEYAGINPPHSVQTDQVSKYGQENGENEESRGVLTGTVITSCFIQTTALPSRVEMEGNNVTFYDDTETRNGIVTGDTSRLVFTHDLNSDEGFIVEKRASIYDTYDNVISWYATDAKKGRHNYMFLGRNGNASDSQRHVSAVIFNVDQDTSLPSPSPGDSASESFINGVFQVEFSQDTEYAQGNTLISLGASKTLFPGRNGFSGFIAAGDGGLAGLGYRVLSGGNYVTDVVFYVDSATGSITTERDILPLTTATYDLGSPSQKFGTFYGSVSACPLPTIDNALDILERIPEPTYVGERGHYGLDRKYFDDLTMPPELLYTSPKRITDIEHNHMLGFLLKTVKELNEKVKRLEAQIG
jgi:hypothetical protein